MFKKVLKQCLVVSTIIGLIIFVVDGFEPNLLQAIGLGMLLSFLPILVINLIKANTMSAGQNENKKMSGKEKGIAIVLGVLLGIIMINIDFDSASEPQKSSTEVPYQQLYNAISVGYSSVQDMSCNYSHQEPPYVFYRCSFKYLTNKMTQQYKYGTTCVQCMLPDDLDYYVCVSGGTNC